MRTLPTICVHRCNVSQVSLHAASGKSGHIPFLLDCESSSHQCPMTGQYRIVVAHDAFFHKVLLAKFPESAGEVPYQVKARLAWLFCCAAHVRF